MVASWPLTWKLGFKSSALVTARKFGKDKTIKDTITPKMKESKVHSTEKSTTKETPKGATTGVEQESQQEQGLKVFGGEGATSPHGTKCTREPPKVPRKKHKDIKPSAKMEVRLREDDL